MSPEDAANTIDVTFVCPRDRQQLREEAGTLICIGCGTIYPYVRGIPVLLNDTSSIFRIADFTSGNEYEGASGYGGAVDRTGGLRAVYRRLYQKLANPHIPFRYFKVEQAIDYVGTRIPSPRILVIGAGDITYAGSDVFYTDVAFGKNVKCICDAHDLPFPDHEFDLVIACAVFEHVADPQRCVGEVTRVLRSDGYVYAITPFLQPVHMGAYDFTRFTYLGHRRLFRYYDDIESGVFGGPASSLAMIMRYTLASFTRHHKLLMALRLFGLLVTYPIRFLDLFLARNPASYDAAFAAMFFGQRRQEPISDRDLPGLFRGGV